MAGGRPTNPRYNVIVSKRNDEGKMYATVLVKNVLALDERFEVRIDENGRGTPRRLVTLAVKPEDGPKLELAKREGVISLALPPFSSLSSNEISKMVENARP